MSALPLTPATGVIVTGGASGIGRATAEVLAAVGRPVALWDIDGAGAERAAAELHATFGVLAIGVAIDLTDAGAIAAAAERTRGALPSIGGLVHSAGVGDGGGVEGFDAGRFDAMMAVHVRAVPLIVQAILPDLRAQPGSAIVALASMQARIANGSLPTYTAAKGAVLSLVHSMAAALAPDGIRINSVSPGMIVTPLLERAIPPGPRRDAFLQRCLFGRFAQAEEVARVVRFLMSDEASYITGTDLLVDGGFLASVPTP